MSKPGVNRVCSKRIGEFSEEHTPTSKARKSYQLGRRRDRGDCPIAARVLARDAGETKDPHHSSKGRSMNTTLAEAKERVRIPQLWHEFGFQGEPRKQCRCPFHEDKTPSFSVFDDGKRWKCHAGCGEGSVIDFLAKAKGLSDEEACLEILKRVGGHQEINWQERPKRRDPAAPLEIPTKIAYSKEIAQRVADSRGLSITAVEFAAVWLKTLIFGKVCDCDCWILTDGSRRCAEARRIDRKPFSAIGTLAERKSHSLRGSCKSWPVGMLPPAIEEPFLKEHVHKILLVEGGPDYLAACQLIAAQDVHVLPVAMLGASQTISADALPHFRNRRVTIVAHGDEAGRTAGLRWAQQIQAAGGLARIFKLKDGDLCDAVSKGATHADLNLF